MFGGILSSSPMSWGCVCIFQLEVIRCVRPQEWSTTIALPSVSFAPLILPTEDETQNVIELGMCILTMCMCMHVHSWVPIV